MAGAFVFSMDSSYVSMDSSYVLVWIHHTFPSEESGVSSIELRLSLQVSAIIQAFLKRSDNPVPILFVLR
jgi:hypothetical protein